MRNTFLIALLLGGVLLLLRETGAIEWKLVQREVHTSQSAGWASPANGFRFDRPVFFEVLPLDPASRASGPPFGAVRFTADRVEVNVATTQFEVIGNLSRPLYKQVRFQAEALLGDVSLETLSDGSESRSITIRDEHFPLSGAWSWSGEAVYRGSITGRQIREELIERFRKTVGEDLAKRLEQIAPAVSSAGN